MNAWSISPSIAESRPVKCCETCNQPISQRGYTLARYERLARFCSSRCRKLASPRLVGCSRCGKLLRRSYRTANPTCRPTCSSQPAAVAHPVATELVQAAAELASPTPAPAISFRPVVYRIYLPLLGAEFDWTVFTPEGQFKLDRALTLPHLHPESIGEAVVLSIRPVEQVSAAA